jgi:acyl-[acyl-carrier-protein]-phospholipid O-acyltransferase/long-chain-fatty-acid--[acyl-carrier-protein] ligase
MACMLAVPERDYIILQCSGDSMSLFTTRRFLPLFITQFLGALNDNLLKNSLVMLITYRLADTVENPEFLVTLAAGIFMLPFFLFSATAGELADKYDRAKLTRLIKLFEIAIVLVASAGFYLSHVNLLMITLFCMGVHSTFFGPIKYALLPQHLRDDELLSGNGYIESGTFLAILLGAILGGLFIMQPQGVLLISTMLLVVAIAGYVSSRFIPEAPAPDASLIITRNIWRATWDVLSFSCRDKGIFLCILGISWFWLVGAAFVAQFPNYTKMTLGGDETVVTLLLATFSIGIAIGSAMCSTLLKGRITARYVPLAALGITIAIIDLYFASNGAARQTETLVGASAFVQQGGWRIIGDLFFLAVCGGIYVVPLYALMQHKSEAAHRARVIAANNIMNALFMVASSVGTLVLLNMAFSVPEIFLMLAVLNGLAGLLIRRQIAASIIS